MTRLVGKFVTWCFETSWELLDPRANVFGRMWDALCILKTDTTKAWVQADVLFLLEVHVPRDLAREIMKMSKHLKETKVKVDVHVVTEVVKTRHI